MKVLPLISFIFLGVFGIANGLTFRSTPIADTYVTTVGQNASRGGTNELWLGGTASEGNSIAFLKWQFNYSAGNETHQIVIHSASISLHTKRIKNPNDTISVFSCASNWTETNLVWPRLPGSTNSYVGAVFVRKIDSMPIDITREVKNITKNKVQILSIMLTGGEDITKLHSREAANSTLLPTVTVVYDYVPRTNTVPTKEPPVTKPPPLVSPIAPPVRRKIRGVEIFLLTLAGILLGALIVSTVIGVVVLVAFGFRRLAPPQGNGNLEIVEIHTRSEEPTPSQE